MEHAGGGRVLVHQPQEAGQRVLVADLVSLSKGLYHHHHLMVQSLHQLSYKNVQVKVSLSCYLPTPSLPSLLPLPPSVSPYLPSILSPSPWLVKVFAFMKDLLYASIFFSIPS